MSQYGTQYVEVIGFARSNGTIDEEVSTNFGNDFGKGWMIPRE
jgi:hypothetical protein